MVIFPGTFDPITLGHLDLLKRALSVFDKVMVAIADNAGKKPCFTVEERMSLVKDATTDFGNVEVARFQGLLVDFAATVNATVIVRGVRNSTDFELESSLAFANKSMNHKIETLLLPPGQQHMHVSSTLVKEIASHGGEVSQFVPDNVAQALRQKFHSS